MIIYVGKINIKKKIHKIFVSDEGKTIQYADKVILTMQNIDERWIQDIVKKAVAKKDRHYCDEDNRRFLLLYILFSIKKDLHFEDMMSVYHKIERMPMGTCYNSTMWLELNKFMRKNAYQYKNMLRRMYIEEPRIGIQKCVKVSFFVAQQVKFLASGKEWLYSQCEKNIEKNKRSEGWDKTLRKRYLTVYPVLKSKHTLSHYYVVEDEMSTLFVKCGFNSNIQTEYHTMLYLDKISKHKELYAFPLLEESNENCIVYPYQKELSLKDILMRRELDEEEICCLCNFFKEVIKDLCKSKVIHRDIHIENIRVFQNDKGKIERCQLIDFGWSCIKKNNRMQTVEEYRDCRYLLGDKYRYSTYAWDDAASCVSILIQHFSKLQLQKCWDRIEEIVSYISENAIDL